MDTKYNGWTNYETWLVNLWLDNDGSSETLREMAESTYDTKADFNEYSFSKIVREYVEETYADSIPESGMISDLVGAAFSSVNWQEIASHYADDLPDPEEEEEIEE